LFVVDTTDIADFITLQLEAPLAPSQSDES
jgi:hypothetical protein